MNALTAVSPGEPGAPGPVKAVSVISAGTVRIHPEIPYDSRKPLYCRPLTSGSGPRRGRSTSMSSSTPRR